jgi:hypothetical protein
MLPSSKEIHLQHFSIRFTTSLPACYEQTACECSKTRKSFKQTGRSIPPKRAGSHNRVRGTSADLWKGKSLMGDPEVDEKKKYCHQPGPIVLVKRDKARSPVGSSGTVNRVCKREEL